MLTDVLLTRDALLEVFPHNLGYFMFGRHTGFAVYFFPGVMAILLFLAATRDRAMWQWLTLAAGVGSAVVLLLYMPFTLLRRRRAGRQSLLPRQSTACSCSSSPPLQTAAGGLIATGGERVVRRAADLSNPFYRVDAPAEHSQDRAVSAGCRRS